jgi:hypothetical protein
MKMQQLVEQWFEAWDTGNLADLPISENFKHSSPFGTIEGKKAYMELVQKNRSKFLGYTFQIHDAMYDHNKACVRYPARQGKDFKLDVSEWYYTHENRIDEIISHYHIGEIIDSRKLDY